MSRSRTVTGQKVDDEAGQIAENNLAGMLHHGRSFSGNERSVCFLNTTADPAAGGRFAHISALSGLAFPDDGRALALVDWDHDGDQDLWISNRNAPRLRLMRNDAPAGNNFLSLRLEGNGTSTNRDAIGARVEVRGPWSVAEGQKSIKSLRAGEGFLSQSSKSLHFGLGESDAIEKVVVHWPDGEIEEFTDIEAGRRYRLVQGSGTANAVPLASRKLALASSHQQPPAASQQARLPMVELLTVPPLPYHSLQGQPHLLPAGKGGILLVNLWASWCAPCVAELNEFAERHGELQSRGISTAALPVAALKGDRAEATKAARFAADRNFPFTTGFATEQLITDLQLLHDVRLSLHQTLPLPSSVLIDETGRLAIIYKGTVTVDQLLADVDHAKKNRPERWVAAAPFEGTSLSHPRVLRRAVDWGATLRILFGYEMKHSGRLETAATQYAEVLKTHPNLAETHYDHGHLLQRLHRFEEAIASYTEAIQLKPDFVEAHNNLGNVVEQRKDFAGAMRHYRNALRINSAEPVTHYNIGNVLLKMNQSEQAAAYYQEALGLNPDFPQAHYNLGNVLMNLNRHAEAAKHYRETIRLRPDHAAAHNNLGGALRSTGQPEDALPYYHEAIRLNPKFAQAHYNLGSTLEDLGRYDEAKPHFQEAYRLNPRLRPAP